MQQGKDRVLMRIKDAIIIVSAVGAAFVAVSNFYTTPKQLQKDMDEVKPEVARHEIQLAVIQSQYVEEKIQLAEIKDTLKRIDKKL